MRGLEPRMGLPTVFETRGLLLSVVTSSQRKQPWMKQVDSTFLLIRPPNPCNRTCVRKQSKRSVSWSQDLLKWHVLGSLGEYGSAEKVCCILGLMKEKKIKSKTNKKLLQSRQAKCLLQGWLAPSTAANHPCTYKRNCSLEYVSSQTGFLLNGVVSSKPREYSIDLTRWILKKGFF